MDGRSREGRVIRELAKQLNPFTLPTVTVYSGMIPMGIIPRKPGVYFLMEGDQIYYIGQSNNVGRRVRDVDHLNVKAMQRKFSEFQIAWLLHDGDEDVRLMLERLLNRRFRPPLDRLSILIVRSWAEGKLDIPPYIGTN